MGPDASPRLFSRVVIYGGKKNYKKKSWSQDSQSREVAGNSRLVEPGGQTGSSPYSINLQSLSARLVFSNNTGKRSVCP
jgi:hypothetical protein